ncbi:MAG TPA: translocation/assembly module TamB domain-containing protein, partial [Gemmatimonadaceae bacterium]
MRRWWVRVIAVVVVLVLLLVGAVFLVTNSDWGRERIRRYIVNVLQKNSHGIIHVGKVTGNLLRGFTLHDLSITDSAKNPFVKADEVWARYSLGTLRGKKIDFYEVRLVRPVIVIDKQPGPNQKWNYERIFPRDTMTKAGPKKTGWGTWMRFRDVTLLDGDITIRSPWAPDPHVTPAEQSDALRKALGPEGRLAIVQVPHGYQKISAFHRINALLPLLRLEDPAYPSRLVEVASMKMIAAPFRPPVADVRGLAGVFEFTGDSIWWKGARAAFPRSRINGDGKYLLTNGDIHLRLHADPVQPADIQWVLPKLPSQGNGKLDFAMDWTGSKSVYNARNMDVTLERSHVTGGIEVTVTDTLAYRDANLRFQNLSTHLIERVIPVGKIPWEGILTGRAAFNGGQHSLALDADVVFDEEKSGRNVIAAVGMIGIDKGGVFNARNLKVTMKPMQLAFIKPPDAHFPVRGTLTGVATLNGSSASIMTAVGDVTHVDRGAVSRATGRASFRMRGLPWYDVDARMHPVALATLGRFAPTVGFRGYGTGPVRLRGSLADLAINTQLTFQGGGYLDMRGTVDLASKVTGYNLTFNTRAFNAGAVIAKAPTTSLTAVGTARGRGFDPATMQADLVANVGASSFDTLSVDSANVRVRVATGIANFDTLVVAVPQGIAQAKGTFGLAAGKTGTLSYHVAIDSLQHIASLVSNDTSLVPPRPAILQSRLAKVKADSSKQARAMEVERAATGIPLPRAAAVDTPQAIRMNQLSGSARADGVATGNIKNFGLKGTASGENIIARGNTIGSFVADYDWINARTPQSQVRLNAQARSVRAMGFDLDSVGAKLTYAKPNGTAEIVISQDNQRTYAANAEFTLNKVRNELRLNNLRLAFDTSVWTSTRVAALHWGQAGVDVENLELRNGPTGRIYVNGLIPKQGSANLDVAVDNLNIGDITALLQSDLRAQGLVSFNVHATGTLDNPAFSGAFGATDLVYNGTTLPEVHGNVSYANQTLTGKATAMKEGGQPFVMAEGTVPINLAITGVTGSRFPTDRQIALNINADSLPMDMLPQMTDYVRDVRGRASGNFRVAGTLGAPRVEGQFALHDGHAHVVPANVNLNQLEVAIRVTGDTVVVDSIAANSKGHIAITGGLGIKNLLQPSFDLHLVANGAQVLNNDRGHLIVDSRLAMAGGWKSPHVTGDVRIRQGVVYIPPSDNKNLVGQGDPALFNVLDTAIMANRELFPTQSAILANMLMDVNLRVDRDVFVRSREANVEVYSDGDIGVHVNRAKETLVLDGVLLSERGEYVFMTRRFNILRGSATFINSTELNPT